MQLVLLLLLLLLQHYLILASAVDVPHQQQQYHRHAGAAGGVVRECERVESEKLEYCCAEAYNDLLSQAEQQLLDNDVSVSGDAVYARAIGRCKRWKQEIVDSRTCAPVFERIRHGASTCSRSPFNDDYTAIKRGHLATQEPNEWVRKRCDKQRFLIWTRNSGDFYAGHKHKRTSMMCQFREAYALNRTLVLDSFVGMSMVHTHTPDDVEVPYTAWFSCEFQDVLPAGIMFYHDFVKGCGAPGVYAQTNDTTVIMPADASRGDMEAHAHVPLLVRDFERTPAPNIRFGYQVCRTKDSGGDKQLTYDLLPGLGGVHYAEWVVRMAREVQAELQQRATLNAESDAMVVCLHVRRGDKLSDNFKKSYPNLDYETSPEGIRAAIEHLVPHGSVLFIATNEPDPVAFFAPLGAYYEVLSLAHFAERLNTTRFLPSSLALVDYQIMDHCSYQIPTFANEDSHGFGRHITLSASNKQLVHR